MANAIFAPALRGINYHASPPLFCYFSFILLLKYAFQSICQQAQLACACPVRASPARFFSIQTFLHTPIKTLSHKLSYKCARAFAPARGAFITTARSRHSAHRCLWRGHCGAHCLWRGHCGAHYLFEALRPSLPVARPLRRALPVRGTPPIVARGAATAPAPQGFSNYAHCRRHWRIPKLGLQNFIF